jgi:hypothetical protein
VQLDVIDNPAMTLPCSRVTQRGKHELEVPNHHWNWKELTLLLTIETCGSEHLFDYVISTDYTASSAGMEV